MKQNSQSLISIVFLTLLLVSCEKEVTNIKLPEGDSKLVVGCFISPQDTLLKVSLTLSNPFFGPNHDASGQMVFYTVTNATVLISDKTNAASIPYNAVTDRYELASSTFPINAGKTYYLTVTTPDGKKVTSSCTVPLNNLSYADIGLDSTIYDDENGLHYKYSVTIKWQDIPSEKNYYETIAYEYSSDFYEKLYATDDNIKNDLSNNGSSYSVRYDGKIIYDSLNYYVFDVFIFNMDENYYKYEKSIPENEKGNQDPFSEPVQTYSNIEGGLGIFCAYQQLNIMKQI